MTSKLSAPSLSALSTRLAHHLHLTSTQVLSAIDLLEQGLSIPIIARQHKHTTQGLHSGQLRHIADALQAQQEKEARCQTLLKEVDRQGHLTDALKQAFLAADTTTLLEILYEPFRAKHKNDPRNNKNPELQALANKLLQNPKLNLNAEVSTTTCANHELPSQEAALAPLRHEIINHVAENAVLLQRLYASLNNRATLKATVKHPLKRDQIRYKTYVQFSSALDDISPQEALNLFSGRKEQALQLTLTLTLTPHEATQEIAHFFFPNESSESLNPWLLKTLRLAWTQKLLPKLETALFARLRERADLETLNRCAYELRQLLSTPAIGTKACLSLDSYKRTEVYICVIDADGQVLDYACMTPCSTQQAHYETIFTLARLLTKYQVTSIGIGQSPWYKKSEQLLDDLSRMYPDIIIEKNRISSFGKTSYANSTRAATELPDLDLGLRGASTIARRLQNPLQEAQKIDFKAIASEYSNTLDKTRMIRFLTGVIEDFESRTPHHKQEPKRKSPSHTPPQNTARFNTALSDALANLSLKKEQHDSK